VVTDIGAIDEQADTCGSRLGTCRARLGAARRRRRMGAARRLSSVPRSRRLLLVHAHPDDETIGSGATMARYVAEGAEVTLLTCTLGEEGEVLVPELRLLGAEEADQLGGYRIGELTSAMSQLGVTDHRFLGGTGRFRDSGMMGTPANQHPRAFWRASGDPAVLEAAVDAAVEVIREVRPQVVITYDSNGDYGHPDHIMAHRVATAAVERTPEIVAKLYWTCTPRSMLRQGFDALKASGSSYFVGVDRVEDLPFGVEDDVVTTAIDARAYASAKLAALQAHATQISVDGPFFALSNMLGREVLAVEYFRLARGELGPGRDADGRETDLFAGVET
jgi:N-acetyl-1-D-myo-inositol-2-amino-2-deoxy-alpha-D-glucopyranoside deacetylase